MCGKISVYCTAPIDLKGGIVLKTLFRVLLSAGLLVLTGVMIVAANLFPGWLFSFYPDFSRGIIAVLAKISSVVPVALCEIFGALLILWFFYSLIRSICKLKVLRWCAGLLLAVSLAVCAFVGIWGLNYYAPSMTERLDLPQEQYTVKELKEAAIYYRDMANAAAGQVERNEDGSFRSADFEELSEAAGEGYVLLAEDYACFDGSTVPVKRLLISPIMGKIGMTGGFICLTGESCVSDSTYPISLPYTMCHEIGHRMAFAREDEANFAAFLACISNERADFQYSAYYNAFLYCYNALYKADQPAAKEVWSGVSELLASDMGRASAHYESIRSETASKITDQVYDGYLKTFSVEEGVQSYGEVADLLLIWYFERVKG